MKTLLIAVAVLVVVAILAGGYFGFVPGVSSIFGSDRPRDLGVRYTQADLQSLRGKTGMRYGSLPADAPPEASRTYSGQRAVTASFTDRELTAELNSVPWKYDPLADAQVRFNADGTVEFSGLLLKDRVPDYVRAMGLTPAEIQLMSDQLNSVPGDPSFYAKGRFEITGNRVTLLDVQTLEVGRIAVPESVRREGRSTLIALVERRMRTIPGFSAKSVTVENGMLNFDGTLPAVMAVAP
ncbi:MAG: hypothetical protein Q7T26_06230 [Dehalococcoidia bacterium]|nr:hypothetical protein [Dehalococcoidia bacterium]